MRPPTRSSMKISARQSRAFSAMRPVSATWIRMTACPASRVLLCRGRPHSPRTFRSSKGTISARGSRRCGTTSVRAGAWRASISLTPVRARLPRTFSSRSRNGATRTGYGWSGTWWRTITRIITSATGRPTGSGRNVSSTCPGSTWSATREPPAWTWEFFSFGLPAMARGAALLKGTREIFSEAFGANGWAEGLRMTKWIADWHIINGISVLSPHAYTMKYNDPDCPQHFNRTSGNPQWRYYQEWTREFRPLQQLIAETDPVYEAAVLYTAESAWVGETQEPSQVVPALETNQVSTVIVPYDAIAELKDHVRTIVLPYVRFVPADAMERLAEFAEAGGSVIVLEAWPQASVDARGDQRVKAAIERLKASRAVLTTLWDLPTQFPLKRVEAVPLMGSVMTALRRANDAQWLILHNRSLSGTASGRVA